MWRENAMARWEANWLEPPCDLFEDELQVKEEDETNTYEEEG